jgi:hypothetical protein
LACARAITAVADAAAASMFGGDATANASKSPKKGFRPGLLCTSIAVRKSGPPPALN